jgi:hypothetical protein
MARDAAEKISPALTQRLDAMAPGAHVRALVMLETAASPDEPPLRGRPRAVARRRAASATRAAGQSALPEIDRVLARHRGRRVAAAMNALGMVPVATTAAGVRALAALDRVKAIVEDQPIALVRPPHEPARRS